MGEGTTKGRGQDIAPSTFHLQPSPHSLLCFSRRRPIDRDKARVPRSPGPPPGRGLPAPRTRDAAQTRKTHHRGTETRRRGLLASPLPPHCAARRAKTAPCLRASVVNLELSNACSESNAENVSKCQFLHGYIMPYGMSVIRSRGGIKRRAHPYTRHPTNVEHPTSNAEHRSASLPALVFDVRPMERRDKYSMPNAPLQPPNRA